MIEYFSHDYHARSDPKIIKLRMKYGFAGVGLYWSIIEILYEAEGRVLRTECERIAYELQIGIERITEIIDTDLFQKDDEYFWSDSVLKRLNIREEISKKARESANKRWGNKDLTTHANGMRTQCDGNAIKEKKRKGKIKEKEIKEKDYDKDNKHLCKGVQGENDAIASTHTPEISEIPIPDSELVTPEPITEPTVYKRTKHKREEFIPPSENEFIEYFKSNGFDSEIAKRAFRGYAENHWKDSRDNKIANWKQKCQHVWFKPEHKSKVDNRTQQEIVEAYRKDGWDVVN
jgi:hypothetical protein